jgi:hypothetical protein
LGVRDGGAAEHNEGTDGGEIYRRGLRDSRNGDEREDQRKSDAGTPGVPEVDGVADPGALPFRRRRRRRRRRPFPSGPPRS